MPKKSLINPSTIYRTLIVLVVIGFITNFDYKYASGCFTYEVPFLWKMKFFYSLISIGLLALGYWVSTRWQTDSILIFELLFWIFRGLVYNGAFDYISIAFFALICLTLRIVLIVMLYKAQKGTITLIFTRELIRPFFQKNPRLAATNHQSRLTLASL